MRILRAIGLTVVILGSMGCSKVVPSDQVSEGITFPKDFPPIAYNNPSNPITKAKIKVGRHLFYDVNLSKNRTISCGSCHAQVHGFADHNTALSFGIYGRMGKRNAPAIVNVAWMNSFMWDGGIRHLDVISIAPLTDTTEMGLTLKEVVQRVKEQNKYEKLFKEAYGSDSINEHRILLSLSQFMLQLISDQSKYDKVRRGTERFTQDEQRGYELFKVNCSSCHQEPLMTNHQFKSNGIPKNSDPGRYRITQIEADKGLFKVPTLRNVELTYPYMHDGSIYSLQEVIESYNEVDRTTHPEIPQFQFNSTQIDQLVAFLKTLTDYSFISNHSYSEIR